MVSTAVVGDLSSSLSLPLSITMQEDDIPNKVQEYKDLEEKEDDKPVWAFICPNPDCKHKNRLKGDPTNFINRPFRCLKCNYVPLLGEEGIKEFLDANPELQDKDIEEGGN